MKLKYFLIITFVLGLTVFTGASVLSNQISGSNSDSSVNSSSTSVVSGNQQGISVNELCSGVSCPFPNSINNSTSLQ